MNVRPAEETEIDQLARVWFDGWQDAHAAILPAELRRLRTLESFASRIRAALTDTRAVGDVGRPSGFCIVKDNEIYQLFVAADARGTGAAAALLSDGEVRIASRGARVAWLACAIGNDRAARFYDKHGWQRVGNILLHVETAEGPFPLDVWRYEKRL